MPKKDLPEPIGKCEFCTVNLYPDPKTGKAKPDKINAMPCGVRRLEKWKDERNKVHEPFFCPYEDKKTNERLAEIHGFELIAGLLGTDYGDPEINL